MRPTQICITTDTEFSIAGHFKCPEQYFPVAEPAVYGEVDGREEALGFMLETFDRYDISSSFFIENTILHDAVKGQINTVNVRFRSQVTTFVFEAEDGRKHFAGVAAGAKK